MISELKLGGKCGGYGHTVDPEGNISITWDDGFGNTYSVPTNPTPPKKT